MEMSDECKEVIDSVNELSMHNRPSMFWTKLQERTELTPDRVRAVMRRWSIDQSRDDDYRDLLTLISDAMDIQSEDLYGKSWDDLCGHGAWQSICKIARIK